MTEFVMRFEVAIIFVLFILIGVGAGAGAGAGGKDDDDASSSGALKLNFYNETCPQAEIIIQNHVEKLIEGNASFAPALLRMQFHDCFIQGCDASVLLDTSPSSPNGTETEKNSLANLSLRGFEFIDQVKEALEKKCPGVVSCADIIALVSRDAVFAIEGPYWEVLTGRRDGNDSSELDVRTELPFPTDNITTLVTKFNDKGLNYTDLVLLSAAHTIGLSNCTSFTNRLYNFSGTGKPDPALDSSYEKKLQHMCPTINTSFKVEMDPNSSKQFDQSYYRQVLHGRGLFSSDAALLTNRDTNDLVSELKSGNRKDFFQRFGDSMIKMSNIGVLTGKNGQIRNKCGQLNKSKK